MLFIKYENIYMKRWAFFCIYEGVLTGGPKRTLDTAIVAMKNGIAPVLISNCESPMTEIAKQQDIEFSLIDVPNSFRQAQGRALKLSPANFIRLRRDKAIVSKQIESRIDQFEIKGWWSRGIKTVLLAENATKKRKIPLVWDIGTEYPSRGIVTLLHLAGFIVSSRIVAQGDHVYRNTFPQWMLKRFSKKCRVIIPGLDSNRVDDLSFWQQAGDPYLKTNPISIIGSINARKNQLLFLNACKRLWGKGYDFSVRVVGDEIDAAYMERCKVFAAESQAMNRIEWYGWSDNIAEILKNSSAIVVCSKHEGLPQTVLESMHSKCPIISVPVGAVPDLLSDSKTGFLAKDHSLSSLETAIERFLNCSESQLQLIRQRAKDTVSKRANHEQWGKAYSVLLNELA